MPSTSPAQARLMAACSHGATDRACPPVSVAREFTQADLAMRARQDGTQKGQGFWGPIPSTTIPGNVSTEVSQDSDGLFYPLMHQGSSPDELQRLANGEAPTDAMSEAAYQSAVLRLLRGVSPFAGPGEQMTPRTP